jgi:sialate O-acetylesterase
MKPFFALLIIAFAAVNISAFSAPAELMLAPVFGDNMVLQRDKPLPVWGQAEAGEKVSVRFAGLTKTTTADSAGNWKVVLSSLPASAAPRTLTVTAANNPKSAIGNRQLTNVLVGEVWLAAGQSNMEFPLSREAHAAQEIPAATNAQIRLLNLAFAGQYFFSKPFGSNEVARMTPEKLFHGDWNNCSPMSAKDFSAIAYYFSREIQRDGKVPVGIINCAVGGSPTEAWIRRAALDSDPDLWAMAHGNWLTNAALDDWCRQRGHENLDAALKAGLAVPGDALGANHHFKPSFLWDAGPARLAPFALRGVLWYQGESNSLEERRLRQHEKLFPLLVQDWRAVWGENVPFLFCQLSSIQTNGYKSAFWPAFRDQQRKFAEIISNTGMAVTSDHGLPNDVHSREKREIGRRLALVARARVYVEKIEFSGPQPVQALARDVEVKIVFSHAAGLTTSDAMPVESFELAGGDDVFYPATAMISGEEVLLSAAAVSSPRRVRYGWQPFSAGNLVNSDGLPVSTFEISVNAK